jgi:hypothetical protein
MNPDRPTRRKLVLVSAAPVALLLLSAQRGQGHAAAAAPVVSDQPFQGPATGISGFATPISSSSAAPAARASSAAIVTEAHREHEIPRAQAPPDLAAPLAPAGSNEVEDSSIPLSRSGAVSLRASAASGVLVSFPGLGMTTKIPPDPILAAGPNHLISAVNDQFAAYSKSGSMLFQKDANSWFSNVLPNIKTLGGAFDPKVIYDEAAGRWILVYLATDDKTESWVLLSVSNGADPTGSWCNIPLRGDVNGTTPSGNWSDYEGVGLDNQAVYITTNQFQLTPNADGKFQYARLRIIAKSQLYGPCGPAVSYYDFWDLRDPVTTSEQVFTLRPALTYGAPGVEYLMNNGPFNTNTYLTLWSLTNPLSGSPTLTSQNVPVTASTSPPNADQLGGTGGTSNCAAPCLIDTGDDRLLGLVYRNGSLWTSHTVAGGTGDAFARVRYVRIGVAGPPTVLEDLSFGADACWYYYPAVAIDQSNNLGMVFTRSCTNEYASVRYTGRATTDLTLQGSNSIKDGESNYLNTASGKNRWGDYSGASSDPSDPSKLWLYGEYAASPTDNWGTWGAEVAITPSGPAACVPNTNTLCLNNSRFRVTASYQSPSGGGSGTAVAVTPDTGYFWFFSSNNVELVIKVVDGRVVNSHFWVFAGGLTNVNVVITVTDTATGETRTYVNPQGTAFQPIQDTLAFAGLKAGGGAEVSRGAVARAAAISAGLERLLGARAAAAPASPAAPANCVADATTLCLNNSRFTVKAAWTTSTSGGAGQAVALTGDTGYFWFFNPNNVELVAKVVTGCPVNARYWFFAGGLTNVNVVVTVTDTQRGTSKTYINPQNTAFQPIQDTSPFFCP